MDASSSICCLLGNPVEHSISPLIHNTLAEMLGINMAYCAHKIEPDRLGEAVRGAYALGIRGMNVTVPYKTAVIPSLIGIDDIAGKIGAVNTLVTGDGGYIGYNTDIIGFERQLLDLGITLPGRDVIIIGAGGVSRAIVYLCGLKGVRRVWLLNRSRGKAQALADEVNERFDRDAGGEGVLVKVLGLDEYSSIPAGKYLTVQTTNVGMYPKTEAVAIMDDGFYDLVETGVDLIFNPPVTLFMDKCMKAGANAENGLKMLLYQGVAAFEMWYDVKVGEKETSHILELMKRKMGI